MIDIYKHTPFFSRLKPSVFRSGIPEENGMKIDTILFPNAFWTTADQAFESATFLADAHNAELLLLHVVDQLDRFNQSAVPES